MKNLCVYRWVCLKLKKRDSNGELEWRGFIESIEEDGIRISNNTGAFGPCEDVKILFDVISDYEYVDGVGDYYVDIILDEGVGSGGGIG